ncbi:NAD(P)H-dependent flavin oxidoreductase [Flavicella sediminum]|uniref:NAD(P)H-dependent flavin oxidoreductase n=1 Tax=Flavicella sediminum TaxID=2585141 RepID=UPI00111FAA7B|nr:nitronate monooxygenase [Flavicella sediminum]
MKNENNVLQKLLGIEHPIILAPMFLVSNVKMVSAAMQKNIAGCIPAMNYRTIPELKAAITELQKAKTPQGAFGFNIIVNKSNLKHLEQLDAICEMGVDFIITSLGNPEEIIKKAHTHGIKVFCDVVNIEHAKKVEALGCDALIAVNSQAGGHRGSMNPEDLIVQLVGNCDIPVISAGGVGNKAELDKMMSFGAVGVSIGSPFIASIEADISDEYKQACVDYGAKDVVVTQKISGTPCTVINTPYVQKVGTKETWIELILNKYGFFKKWVKILRYLKGSSDVANAAKKVTYKTVWVAGPSIEHTKKIDSVKDIIDRFIK